MKQYQHYLIVLFVASDRLSVSLNLHPRPTQQAAISPETSTRLIFQLLAVVVEL